MKQFPFDFQKVEKKFESYTGINVQLRYFLRVTITRGALYSNVRRWATLSNQLRYPHRMRPKRSRTTPSSGPLPLHCTVAHRKDPLPV